MEYQSGDNVNDAYSHPLTAERDFVPKRLYLLINTFPTLLLILLSPLYLHRYYQQPIRILSGALLWIKFVGHFVLRFQYLRVIEADQQC
jgi:hypothetical protein